MAQTNCQSATATPKRAAEKSDGAKLHVFVWLDALVTSYGPTFFRSACLPDTDQTSRQSRAHLFHGLEVTFVARRTSILRGDTPLLIQGGPNSKPKQAMMRYSAGPARGADMASTLSSPISKAALLIVAAAFLPMALGHEHGTDHIEEGKTVSKDPIVCCRDIRVLGRGRKTRR